MKKCQENVWVLEHLNSEQELSIKIEKDVAKHYHVNTKTSFWLLSNRLKPNIDEMKNTNANLYFAKKNL